jgi:hypothetical protein
MANPPVNDYSLDPYQVDEDEINTLYKRALEKTLRKPKQGQEVAGILVGGPDFGSTFRDRIDKYAGEREMTELEARKRALAEKYQAQLAETLRNPTPEALASFPGTRSIGLEATKRRANFGVTQDIMKQIDAGLGGQTPGGQSGQDRPPLRQIEAMMRSGDPEIEKQGKHLWDMYYKPQDPSHIGYQTRSGGMGVTPGAPEAYGVQQDTRNQAAARTTPFPREERDAAGNILPPRSVAAALGTGGGAPNTSALSGAVAASTQAPSVATTPPRPALPTATGATGLPPEDAQRLFDIAMAPATPAKQKQDIANKLANAGYQFDTNSKQLIPPTQQLPQPAGERPQVQQLPQPAGQAPQIRPLAGRGYNPEQHKANVAENTVLQGTAAQLPYTIKTIQELAAESPTIPSGPRGPLQNATNALEGFITGRAPKQLGDAEAWTSKIKQAAYPLLRATFGPQFTEKEGEKYMATWGNLATTEQGRQKILADLAERAKDTAFRAKAFNEAVQAGADPYAYIEQLRSSRNPNQPGAAATAPTPGQALPGSNKAWERKVAAAQAETGYDPSKTGVLDFLKRTFDPRTQEAKDVGRNIVSLPGALASESGREAAKDVYGNIATGARQLAEVIPGVPLADRSGVAAEKARQAQRAEQDPKYKAAQIFNNIFNPTALIGGTTTAPLKIAAAVGTQSALTPQESLAKQLEEGVVGGTIGAGTTLASKLIPATGKAPGYWDVTKKPLSDAEKRAAELGITPTNRQLNPSDTISKITGAAEPASALAQIKQMSEGLMKEAGIKAKEVSNKVLADRDTQLSQGFKDMFSKTDKARVTSADYKALQDAIRDHPQIEKLVASGEAPTLAALRQAMEDSAKRGVVAVKVPLDKMHQAWQEIAVAAGHRGKEAGALREIIEPIIKGGLEKAGKPGASWDTLREQWGALKDLTKVWGAGAGQGEGRAAGLIRPSAIEQFSKELPYNSAMKETAGVTKGLGIADFHETPLPLDVNLVNPKSIIDAAVGLAPEWLTKYANKSVANADPGTKKLLELLRAGIARGPGEVIDESRGQ